MKTTLRAASLRVAPLAGVVLLCLAPGLFAGCGDSEGSDGGDETGDGGDTAATGTSEPGDGAATALAHLCDPCDASTTCAADGADGACVKFGPGGSFCAVTCEDADGCPDGYSCLSVITAEGSSGTHCVPAPQPGSGQLYGECACSAAATEAGLSTTCSAGSCLGTRLCSVVGLSACDAGVPTLEVCDGKDNDCDGTTDEQSCDDFEPCTEDACDGAGGCTNAPVSDGATCDDGDACTLGEACVGGACTPAATVPCSDDNPCTADDCDGLTGICSFDPVPDGAACEDGDLCTDGDACVFGTCTSGALKSCDDAETCTVDACDTTTGLCSYDTLADGEECDDGFVCTWIDTCAVGTCIGQGVNPCDDDEACTADVCDVGSDMCLHEALDDGPCDDGDPCTTSTMCTFGTCHGDPVPGCVYATPPDVAACEAGQLGGNHRILAAQAVEAARALVGLPAVAYDKAGEPPLHALALMVAAGGAVSAAPEEPWPCYDESGAFAGATGSVHLFEAAQALEPYEPWDAVVAMIIDAESPGLERRRRLLDPFLRTISYATVDGAPQTTLDPSTMWVQAVAIDAREDVPQPVVEPPPLGLVAVPMGPWPADLFAPDARLSFGLLFDASDYWTNQLIEYTGVVITVSDPGSNLLEVSDLAYTSEAIGLPNHVQWTVAGLQEGVSYTVRLENVFVVNQIATYEYGFSLE